MRLTLMTDYALRLLMHLARKPGRLCTISEIARVHAISEAHLMKVTHQLALRGWIVTVRGKGGGMRLAHAPSDIVLGAVVRGMEPDLAIVECLAGASACTLTPDCHLAGVLGGALDSFMAHLDGFTLADLVPAQACTDIPAPPLQRERRA